MYLNWVQSKQQTMCTIYQIYVFKNSKKRKPNAIQTSKDLHSLHFMYKLMYYIYVFENLNSNKTIIPASKQRWYIVTKTNTSR